MLGQIRVHNLMPGDPLDRRRVSELFLQFANKLSSVQQPMLDRNIFVKTMFHQWVFEEFRANNDGGFTFVTPDWSSQYVPGTVVDIRSDDSDFMAVVTWSINITAKSSSALWAYAWPVVGDESLHSASDYASADNSVFYNATDPDIDEGTETSNPIEIDKEFSMSGEGSAVTSVGTMRCGLMIFSNAKFHVTRSSIVIRSLSR